MHFPGPKNSPVYTQSLPEHCLSLKKIKNKEKKRFLLNKGAFKEYTIYRACSLQKTPLRGASPKQKKRKKKKTKKTEKEKRKENRERSKDRERAKE